MPITSPAARNLAIELFLLLGLTFLATLFRITLSFAHPAYRPGDATAYYPAEAALQYRWAHDLAVQGKLPSVDRRAQWPEGLRFGTDITPVMEHIAAWLFRSTAPSSLSFFDFSIWFVAAVSSLGAILAYLAVRLLGGGVAGALLAAFLAGFHPCVLERVVRNFGRENFALFFVFVPVACVLALWRKQRASASLQVIILAFATISQAVAFASWHMARPLFELHALVLIFTAAFFSTTPFQLRRTVVWVISTAPFWVLLPVLQVRRYAVSPNILMLLFLGLGLLLVRQTSARLMVLAAAILARALAGAAATADDSHISEVVLAKLTHLLGKPADPNQLSPEARLMWIEAFNSPTLAALILYALPVVLALGLLGFAARHRFLARLRTETAWRGLFILFLVHTAAYLTFERLVVLFLFSAAVLVGLVASEVFKTRWRWFGFGLVLVLLVAVGGQSAAFPPIRAVEFWVREKTLPPQENAFQNRLADTQDLLHWLRSHTQRDDVVVAWFGLSSQIYAYADRPVVVQSKFENPFVRPKVLELANALYGKPEKLEDFCTKYGARYVVYEAPMVLHRGRDSYRYVAGKTFVETTSAVALMHFQPHELDAFRLVYQNRGFRVFRVTRAHETTTPLPARYGWFPLYDREWCSIDLQAPILDDSKLDEAVRKTLAIESQLVVAELFSAEGKFSESLRILRDLLGREPRLWQAAALMARIYARSGNIEAAKKACTLAEIGYPQCPELPSHLRHVEGVFKP